MSYLRLRVSVLALVAVSLCMLAGMSGLAKAAEPWWHVGTLSAPPGPTAGGVGAVNLVVANLGDRATAGTVADDFAEFLAGEDKRLVSVVDRLPVGVTPTEAHVAGNGSAFAGHESEDEGLAGVNLCSFVGQVVTCVYVAPVRPYEQIVIEIGVTMQTGAGDGLNEVSVSGGEAKTALARHQLALEGPASYGTQSYEMTPEKEGGLPETQAGSHPFQMTTTLMLNGQTALVTEAGAKAKHLVTEPLALTKDARFVLPPGFVGNPTQLPKCSTYVFLQQFAKGSQHCPNNTVIGAAAPLVAALGVYTPGGELSPVYSLEPSVGEAARFGFFTIVGPAVLDVGLRTGGGAGGGYNVVVSVNDIPSSAPFIASVVTLWGDPADARHDNSRNLECIEDFQAQETGGPEPSCPAEEQVRPFLILPTSCTGPLRTTVQVDSWSNIGQFTEPFEYASQDSLGQPYGQDGCNRLNFEPSIAVAPDGQQASTPTGLSVMVHVAQDASLNPSGLAESTVKDTTVALPAGVALNPAGADGLLSCSLAEIGLETVGEPTCPGAAKVGTLEIRTPLLPHPLVGAAYLATQEANPFGSLIALYLVARDPISGVHVKLAGEVKPDGQTGQLVSAFRETPQTPFEDLKLHFFGGSRAPLGTPALCGAYTTTATIAPWSENAPAHTASQFLITSGPNGGPCSNPLPFAPSLTSGSLNLQAGAFTPFTTTMSREDGNQNLDSLELHMPPGLSGLLAGVKLCGEEEANSGICGPESLIGETTVSVGLGGNPYTVKGGRVYITGPYEGAPFGLSIVNPAKAGPFDLEKTAKSHPPCDCLVVRAKIEVDPVTAALTIASDDTGPYRIPQMLEGIPLQIKHVNVTVNRPNFTFNPTNCSPMQITGRLTSSEAAASALHIPFQVTNCATLKFKPSLRVRVTGRTSRARGAGLYVKLSYPRATFGSQANIAKVKVDLPRQLPSRLSTLQKACPDSAFDRNPATCPAASRVGTARATTPLLPVQLTGPAYFVSHGGAKFPELIVVLSGYGVTVDLHGETFISRAGVTSSTFRTVPDVPVGTFELNLPQGSHSALAANGNLCAHALKMPTAFTAQNGAALHRSTIIAPTGCARHHSTRRKR